MTASTLALDSYHSSTSSIPQQPTVGTGGQFDEWNISFINASNPHISQS
jgi:hypothetical protein